MYRVRLVLSRVTPVFSRVTLDSSRVRLDFSRVRLVFLGEQIYGDFLFAGRRRPTEDAGGEEDEDATEGVVGVWGEIVAEDVDTRQESP